MMRFARLADHLLRLHDRRSDDALVARLRGNVLEKAPSAIPFRGQPSKASRPRARRLFLSVAFGAIAGMLALWMVGPVTCRVGGRSEPLAARQWIEAPADAGQPLPIWFSDGTVVEAEPRARLMVAALGIRGAQLTIAEGRVHIAVVHRAYTQWILDAGPFRVHVTGTRFSVDYRSDTTELTLALTEGSVSVSSECLERSERVTAGQYFRARCGLGGSADSATPPSAELTRPIPISDAKTTEVPSPSSAPAPEQRPRDVPTLESRQVSLARDAWSAERERKVAMARWKKLAVDGHTAEALAAALDEGFDTLCDSSGAADVLKLADLARRSGDIQRARVALAAVRRRFPGSDSAAVAAFDQGVVAYDSLRDYAGAARGFESYLRETPNGLLRREALGRLLEARRRSGDTDGARNAARQYLTEYPTGPNAALARTLLK